MVQVNPLQALSVTMIRLYFLDKNGIMKTGWIKSSGSWYYLNDNGTLAVDQWIDNYYVDSTGKMTKIQ